MAAFVIFALNKYNYQKVKTHIIYWGAVVFTTAVYFVCYNTVGVFANSINQACC